MKRHYKGTIKGRVPADGRVLILKANQLCAAALGGVVRQVLPRAHCEFSHHVADAQAKLAASRVDLMLTGIGRLDGDILDFLSNDVGHSKRAPTVLVVTGRKEPCLLARLWAMPIYGVFDPLGEGLKRFAHALRSVVAGTPYWSASVLERVQQHCLSPDSICRCLTPTEQLVLSVIGDGCDDDTAAKCLGLKPSGVLSVRRDLHRKLGIHHKGDLVRLAVQQGFVQLMPDSVDHPGYAALIAAHWSQQNGRRVGIHRTLCGAEHCGVRLVDD